MKAFIKKLRNTPSFGKINITYSNYPLIGYSFVIRLYFIGMVIRNLK